MTIAEIEKAACQLPEGDLIDLTERLYNQINFPGDEEITARIRLADERERASALDPNGDSPFDEFIGELKETL